MLRRLAAACALAAVLTGSAGCARYVASPLTPEAVRAALAVPSPDSLAVRGARLHHAALAPVALDLADGLTPDEAAVVAVLTNPTLRARRAARGVVAAQLFAEGLLAPPQIAASADVPVTGDSAAQTAVGLGVALDLSALVTRSARLAAGQAVRDSTDLGIAYAEWQIAQSASALDLARQRVQAARLAYETRRHLVEIYGQALLFGQADVVTGRGRRHLVDDGHRDDRRHRDRGERLLRRGAARAAAHDGAHRGAPGRRLEPAPTRWR